VKGTSNDPRKGKRERRGRGEGEGTPYALVYRGGRCASGEEGLRKEAGRLSLRKKNGKKEVKK